MIRTFLEKQRNRQAAVIHYLPVIRAEGETAVYLRDEAMTFFILTSQLGTECSLGWHTKSALTLPLT